MALDQFHHGVRVVEVSEGTRTIRTVATAVIGIICTSSDADTAYFPLNKPVLIANRPAAIAKAGSTGNLKKSLQTIYDTVNTIVIAVRVADGADAVAFDADACTVDALDEGDHGFGPGLGRGDRPEVCRAGSMVAM